MGIFDQRCKMTFESIYLFYFTWQASGVVNLRRDMSVIIIINKLVLITQLLLVRRDISTI